MSEVTEKTHPFDMIEEMVKLRDYLKSANTMQRMAMADKIAETAIACIIALAGQQRTLALRVRELEGKSA